MYGTVDSLLERRLTAIFYADVAGYSKLTGDDEEGTHRQLSVALDRLSESIRAHRGVIVHYAGDAVLAEFRSILDAMSCAVEFQAEAPERDAEIPIDKRVQFRIGVNLGEVIVDRGDIYGDGVNVAARLESLASTGGIALSRAVHDQVKNRLPLRFEYLGEQTVKNIAEPVPAYRVILEVDEAARPQAPRVSLEGPWRKGLVVIAAVLVTVVLVGVGSWFFVDNRTFSIGGVERSSAWLSDRIEMLAANDESLVSSVQQTLPSVAVLPLRNLGGDATQDYFSDGMTNDIISDLSRFGDLVVIAASTMSSYRGKNATVRSVSQDLGVRYVVEGDVEQRSDALRVSIRLSDGALGHQIWANRYDRRAEDFFDVRDEIVGILAGTIASQITRAEIDRARRKQTGSLEAHDYLMRGRALLQEVPDRGDNREARRLYKKAIEKDPHYARPHAELAYTYLRDMWYGWTEFPNRALDQARQQAMEALDLEDENSRAHAVLGQVYLHRGHHDLALEEFERAMALNPNDPYTLFDLGEVYLWSGRIQDSIKSFRAGRRLNPRQIGGRRDHLAGQGLAHYILGDYEQAINLLERDLVDRPQHYFSLMVLAAAFAKAGRIADAQRTAEALRRVQPFFKVDSFRLFRDPAHNAMVIDGMRAAGL